MTAGRNRALRRLGGIRLGWFLVVSLAIGQPGWSFDQTTTVGFEDAGLWKTTAGTLGLSTTHTQGNSSLAWTLSGFGEITSTLISTTAGIGSTLTYQVRMPSVAPDPNWRGDTQVYITSISRGVNHQFIGQVSLAGFPLGTFKLASFTIPSAIRTSLAGTVNDIRIHIALNTPTTRAATYLLDDLRAGLTAPAVVDDVALARRVMSFESAPDWTTTGPATLTATTTKSGGASALAIATGGGWIPIVSRPLRIVPGLTQVLSLDVMLPPEQPNPSWFGAIQLYVNAPSVGLNNQFLSQAELTGLSTGSFIPVQFVLPDDTLTKLRGRFDDLQFTVILNLPSGAARTYRIDELHSSQIPTSVVHAARTPGLTPVDLVGINVAGIVSIATARDGVLGQPIQTGVPEAAGTQASCIGDFDGNRTTDIMFVNPRTRFIGFLSRFNIQVPTYDLTNIRTVDATTPMGTPGGLACADIDGDGDIDAVTSFSAIEPDSGILSTAYAYLNQGNGSFTRQTLNLGFPAGIELAGKALADFNGDGRADLAVLAAGDTSDGNQLFVFPASGSASAPYSASSRITIPSTNVLTTLSQPLWGALTIIDANGDHHPDIWALGNRGLLLTVRSLGGSQFAAPEFGGVVPQPGTRFDIVGLDTGGDHIPDLIVSPRSLGPEPDPTEPPIRIWMGIGGGMLPIPSTLPPGFMPPNATTSFPPPIILPVTVGPQEFGLVKGSPVVTTYLDDRFEERPSIFMVSVDGHLLERLQYVEITVTQLPPIPQDTRPINGAAVRASIGNICFPTFCEVPGTGGIRVITPQTRFGETRVEKWTWVDHGTPPGTKVISEPAVMTAGPVWQPSRELFMRGLDGHLWQLEIKPQSRQWIDRGLPSNRGVSCAGDIALLTPIFPLVGRPAIIPKTTQATLLSSAVVTAGDVYSLDAAGNLQVFHWSSTSAGQISCPCTGTSGCTGWDPSGRGPIGKNNCVGQTGRVGDGSPAVMDWLGDDLKDHYQVVVVDSAGSLFSLRDGVWEEALTTGLDDAIVSNGIRFTPVCPNNTLTVSPPPSSISSSEKVWKKKATVRGTPATMVWYEAGRLQRLITAWTPSGDLREFRYGVGGCRPGESTLACLLRTVGGLIVTAGQERVVPAPQDPNANFLGIPTSIARVPPTATPLLTPFPLPITESGVSFCDVFASDPSLVQDASGQVLTLANSEEGDLTVVRQTCPTTGCPVPDVGNCRNFSPTRDYRRHIINRLDNPRLKRLTNTPRALLRAGELTVFATRGMGILTSSVEPPGNVNFAGADHPTDNPPVPISSAVGTSLGCVAPGALPGSQIFPQFVSEQRRFSDQEKFRLYPFVDNFNTGYNSERLAVVEGTVIASHIANIDTPINHTVEFDTEAVPRIRHDWNLELAPDIKYQGMLSDANVAEGGHMEIEWEVGSDMMATDLNPAIGDHAVIRGRHIFDCGHPPFTREIHPPDAMVFLHGSRGTLFFSNRGGPSWYQRNDINLPDPFNEQCRLAGNVGDFLNVRNLLFGLECQRRASQDLFTIGPRTEFSCHFSYDHSMTDVLALTNGVHDDAKDVPLEFDVPLPPSPGGGAFPSLPPMAPGLPQPIFVPTPSPHFHVAIPASAMPIGPTAMPFEAIWANPPAPPQQPRAFTVCFEPVFRRNHDQFFGADNLKKAIDAKVDEFLESHGGLGGEILAKAFIDPFIVAPIADALCDGDQSPEPVVFATVNGSARRLQMPTSGVACFPPVLVREDETLSIGAHGYECDFSCGEHWDDEFATAFDDLIGKVKLAFTKDQNFGAPSIVGKTNTFTLSSQPELNTALSRVRSAGDYDLTVTITEGIVMTPP